MPRQPSKNAASGRKTPLPDARISPRFAGISTFCRFPTLESLGPSAQKPDWAIFGAPFDGGVTYRPGARFGPRAIREQSAYVKPYHLEHGLDLAKRFLICDAGDAPVHPYSARETQDAVCAFALKAGGPFTRLCAVGGDHSIALGNMRAVHRRFAGRGKGKPAKKPGLSVIHFDSHLDTVDVVWGEKYTHASPFLRAVEEGIISPQRMVSIGIKGPLNTATDLDYAKEHGIELITYADWRHRDGMDRFDRFINSLRETGEPVYLTFDIDVIDPAYAPGTGTPSAGGFTSAEAFDLLRLCKGVNVVGADIVEVLPAMDVSGVTAFLAAHVMFEILCLPA